MGLIKSKQIEKVQAAPLRVSALTVASSATSTTVTTAITSVLSTAGDGGVSVPLQASSSGGLGVITTGANNRCEIYDATSKDKILAANGEEVYGRLTESAGVYTLTYFTLPNTGTETSYTFPSGTSIDFEFGYRFDFARLPVDALISMSTRNISDDPSGTGTGAAMFAEQVTVTATNTLAALTKTPTSASVLELLVNGASQDSFVDFSLSGKTITWNAGAAGFALATTDRVVARYPSLE